MKEKINKEIEEVYKQRDITFKYTFVIPLILFALTILMVILIGIYNLPDILYKVVIGLFIIGLIITLIFNSIWGL